MPEIKDPLLAENVQEISDLRNMARFSMLMSAVGSTAVGVQTYAAVRYNIDIGALPLHIKLNSLSMVALAIGPGCMAAVMTRKAKGIEEASLDLAQQTDI